MNKAAINLEHPIFKKFSQNNGARWNFRLMAQAAIESAEEELENCKKILSDPEFIKVTKKPCIEGVIKEVQRHERIQKDLLLFAEMILEITKEE